MSTISTNNTTSAVIGASTVSTEKSQFINKLQCGWARVTRVRTLPGNRKNDPSTLHAYLSFVGGDSVDCIISGTAARELFLDYDLEVLAKATVFDQKLNKDVLQNFIGVQVDVGDVFSTTWVNKATKKDDIGRKGRVLKVRQLLINGESQFDDNSRVIDVTQTSGSGYLRNMRTYNKDGVPTDAVTIQFAYGKRGELAYDTHSLDVTDPALLELLGGFEAMANAVNPLYNPNNEVEGVKKYAHSVWVSAVAVDCKSKLFYGNDKLPKVGRSGTLKAINRVYVDGQLMYDANPKLDTDTTVQADPVAVEPVNDEAQADF